MSKDLTYLCHIGVEECYKLYLQFYVSFENSARKDFQSKLPNCCVYLSKSLLSDEQCQGAYCCLNLSKKHDLLLGVREGLL